MSGMVGVLRSLGAGIKHSPSALRSHRFEHDVLPASLHFDEPNPDIPFRDLNLQVAGEAIPLQRRNGTRFAGVSSFGFGGTNAHVVLADAPKSASAAAATEKPSYLMLSAHTKAALAALSSDYWALVEDADTDEIDRIAAAAGHRRERLAERLVVPLADVEALRSALDAAAEQAEDLGVGVRGTGVGKNGAVAFVFSGNGSQWPGIGCSAYEANAAFRRRFDQIDAHFKKLSGWSLKTEMFAADLEAETSRKPASRSR